MGLFNREKRGGAPAELYWFRFGTTTYGAYTSQDIARTAVIPAAVSLSGGEIVQDFTPLAIDVAGALPGAMQQ
jgi:hypothetical protein